MSNAELTAALQQRSLAMDSTLQSLCANVITELGVSQADLLDELDAIAASSGSSTITRSQLESARKAVEKRSQRAARLAATPAPKFDKSNAHLIPGFNAEMRPPAASSTPAAGMAGAKRPLSAASSGGPASGGKVPSARSAYESPPATTGSAMRTPATGSGSKPAPAVIGYADRMNAGDTVDTYAPATVSLPMPETCGPYVRPTMDTLRSAGYEMAPISKLGRAPGRLLDAPPSFSQPLPLVSAGIETYSTVVGLRVANPLLVRQAAASSAAPPASPSQPSQSQAVSELSAGEVSPSAAASPGAATEPLGDLPGEAPPPPSVPLDLPVDRNAHDAFRWMFATQEARAENLDGRIAEMEDAIGLFHGVADSIVPVGTTSQEPVVYVGRVAVDGEGKLNASSVLLEGHSETTLSGLPANRIPVDLSEVPQLALFPGQIVGVRGMNTRGAKITAQQIYHGAPPAPLVTSAANARVMAAAMASSGPLRVWAAAGPFCLHSDLAFQPLTDIFIEAKACTCPPDVIILMGPFVDAEHPRVKDLSLAVTDTETNQEFPATFKNLWEWVVCSILQEALSSADLAKTHVVIVPSNNDVNHDACYPQSALRREDFDSIDDASVRERITVISNPGSFFVGGVLFGATATDVLFQLNADNTLRTPPGTGPVERLPRMAAHLLEQRSFYPIYPPANPVDTPLEVSQLWHVGMPAAPDVLLLPSKLKAFTKPVGHSLVVNPGHLTRGITAGTYARIFIYPQQPSDLKTVSITEPDADEEKDYALPNVPERARVDILRI